MTTTDVQESAFDVARSGVGERLREGLPFRAIEDYVESRSLDRDARDALWFVLYGARYWRVQRRERRYEFD